MSLKERLVLASLPLVAAIAFTYMDGPWWVIASMLMMSAQIIAFCGPDYYR